MKNELCVECLFSLFVVVQIKLRQKCNQSILGHGQLLVEELQDKLNNHIKIDYSSMFLKDLYFFNPSESYQGEPHISRYLSYPFSHTSITHS